MASQSPALLVIDVQKGMDEVPLARNNPTAERQIALLLAAWRGARWPVIHVQHMSTEPDSPLRPGRPGNALKDEVRPETGEPLFQKTVNSAFIGTALEQHLRSHGIQSLVLVGLTTDQCVSTTARMAGNLGFEVMVVDDATATFDRTGPDGVRYPAQQMHRVELASLHREFAEVVNAGGLLERFGLAQPR
jgi:nicotinamidase-related amidase